MRAAHMDAHIKGKTFSVNKKKKKTTQIVFEQFFLNNFFSQCTMCDKKLQTRTSYRNHMKRHTEDKKYACTYCDRKFFTKYHAKLHISKIHKVQEQLTNVTNNA